MFAPILCVLLNRSWHPLCGTRHLIFPGGDAGREIARR